MAITLSELPQGLNKNAYLITETELDIKEIIINDIMNLAKREKTTIKLQKAIRSCSKNIDNKEFKKTVALSLALFANKVYIETITAFQVPNLTINEAITAVKEIDKGYNIATPNNTYMRNYMGKVKERLRSISTQMAKEDYTSRVSLRNIAEIVERQEYHEQEIESFKQNNIELVWIVPHANCSERCEPFQGKLYSISNNQGVIDNIPYEPLSNATDIFDVTKAGKVYKNGCISGFNCRHKLEPYKHGSRPVQIPAKVIEKQREVNNTQRAYERQIRRLRSQAILFKDVSKTTARMAKIKAKAVYNDYKEYSREKSVAFYPSRVEVD